MKTTGGYYILDFEELEKPIDHGNLEPHIFKGTVVRVPDSEKTSDYEITWDKFGKCANWKRSDCFIDPQVISNPDEVSLLPKGFPTQTKDITGKQICLGDKVCYNFKGESNGYFIVVFENNAFRKSYPTWDQENEKPLLEYGRQAEEMKLKIVKS